MFLSDKPPGAREQNMAKCAGNTLYTNDNLYVLSGLNSGLVDLIYLDPPFNTKRMYSAPVGSKAAGASFKDMWAWNDVDEYYLDAFADQFPALAMYITNVGAIHCTAMMAYLTYMVQRLVEMYRVLKETGLLYLHCDTTASHYLKHLLDGIFGKSNFRNEIIWHYGAGHPPKKDFARKHDVLFRYSKSNKYAFYSDDKIMRIPFKETATKIHFKHVDADGRRYRKYDSGKIAYLDEGKVITDVWTDIDSQEATSPISKEYTGYPTQKPLSLLKRIITASSKEDDLVMDPFCGCATTCVAAQQLGRKWIGIDVEKQSVNILIERLSGDAGLFKDFVATDQIPKRSDLYEVLPSKSVKQRLYKEQKGQCKACGAKFEICHLEIDHIISKSKGGGDYYENYQLLCGNCNRIKGDRPMEYLRLKIETREKMRKPQIFFGE